MLKRFLRSTIYLSLLLTSVAHADVISVPAFSADSGVAHLETFRTTVINAINGQISGSAGTGATKNILADSISEPEMADDANPRLRDAELLSIGTDSFATGSLVQSSYVASGGVPATDPTLTSNISAIVAYVNGYRISKGATSETYTASKDTYIDISQSGLYTLSPVANGATAPAVASNSGRIAKVVTSGTAITSVTDLANRRLPGLVTPSQYRSGLLVSRDSTTTITVLPGTCEINNVMLSKTATTTLTISTPGDWAGGSSLQAVSTFGYVGMDASGNLRLHTTKPAFTNYGVSLTDGKLRYATWSSTVYRILGWFYMNSTGSGQLNAYEVGNIKEADVPNANFTAHQGQINTASTTYVDDANSTLHMYTSGNPLSVNYTGGVGNSATNFTNLTVSVDSAGIIGTDRGAAGVTSSSVVLYQTVVAPYQNNTLAQGTHTIQGRYDVTGNTGYINESSIQAEEK